MSGADTNPLGPALRCTSSASTDAGSSIQSKNLALGLNTRVLANAALFLHQSSFATGTGWTTASLKIQLNCKMV
jgi:hypothetical protein